MNYIKTSILILSMCVLSNINEKDSDKGKIFIDSFIQNVLHAKGDCTIINMDSYINTRKYTKAQKKGAKEMFCLQIGSLYKHLKPTYTIKDIIPYYQAKKEHLPGFYEINGEHLKNVYFLILNDNELIPFKLNDEKDEIISMSAMNKGSDTHYLLEY